MFLRKSFDKKTGIYRTKFDINNFKLKVSLKKLNALIKVPKFNFPTSSSADAVDGNDENIATDEIETHTIYWQQKILSFNEIKLYTNKENCKTDVQKEYHRLIETNDLAEKISDDKRKNIIFTYVTEDCYDDDDDAEKNTDKLNGFMQKNNDNVEFMYIAADLNPQTILFTIKWHNNDGLFTIYPDFNLIDENPYLQEIYSDSLHMYLYAIENVSKPTNIDPQMAVPNLNDAISTLSNLSIRNNTSLFALPTRRCTNMLILLEIKLAEHFEYDNLHVRFNVHIPDRCEIINDSNVLYGSTHSSTKIRNSTSDKWHIGYCHELDICCKDDFQYSDFIKITYEVVSIDGWNRERNEGYTVQTIPFETGYFEDKLPCYRVVENNKFIDRLERYFIGGRKDFDQHNFNANSTKEITINRYGNETISTGLIHVTRHVVMQKDANFLNNQNKVSDRNDHKCTTKHLTIDDVVAAYHKAKLRLEATKTTI